MNLRALLAVLIVVALFSCSKKKPVIKTGIIRHAHLSGLPSASGVEYTDNNIYIIGDDIRWLLTLNDNWEITDSLALSSVDTLVNNRTPGKVKADFESMAHFKYQQNDYLLVFSSGSKQVSRDTAYLVNLSSGKTFIKKNIRSFYEQIKQQAGIPEGNEINIEGLAVSTNTVYIFHRGNVNKNFMAGTDLQSLMQYLTEQDSPLPEFSIYYFDLPEYEGATSGFSGACIYPGQSGILFTASLEDTKSETADGAILGSYIGYIPFDGLSKGTYYASLLTDDDGETVTAKLESITVRGHKNNKIDALTVSDNDDGSSDIYELELEINIHY
jgi:hypothetical protein